MQNAVFQLVKDGILAYERRPFGMQKAVFCKTYDYRLYDKRQLAASASAASLARFSSSMR